MTRDPFDHLEDQLRTTVAKRRQRRWLRPAGVAIVGVALTGGGVAVAGGVFSSDGPSPAARAVAAGEAATRSLPVCVVRWDRNRKTRLVSGAVDPRIRADYGVFRRPARPGEARSFNQRLLNIGGRDVLRSGIRVTRAASGRRYVLILSFGPGHAGPRDPVACLSEVRKAALARPEAADAKVRARIAEILDKRAQRAQDLLSGRSQYLIVMSLIDKTHRSAGGGGTIIKNGRVPAFGSIGAGGVPRKVHIDGLVPDEVHDIQVVDRDGNPRARSVIVPVSGNVYDAVVPRRMGPRMTLRWRARDGHIVRSTHIRY